LFFRSQGFMDPFDNMGMQVAPPNGQLFNQCKWRHMVVKF